MTLFEVAIWVMLLAGSFKIGSKLGWVFINIVLKYYENRRFKNQQKNFKTYIEQNKLKYEKEQTESDTREDQEIPKRD